MHKRKNISIMLTFILFIGLIFGSGNEAKALGIDSTVPAQIKLILDKQEATLGENISLEIQTGEESDKLGDKAYVTYVNDVNKKVVKEVELIKKESSFVGNISINEEFTLGTWKIDFIVMAMNERSNVVIYNNDVHNFRGNNINYFDMLNGNFLIKEFAGYELFENVTVNLGNAKFLDTVKVTIDADASNGELADNAYAVYALENEGKTITNEVKLSLEGTNKYAAQVIIDESYRPGTWKLDYIILKDKSGHTDIVYNKELHGTIDTDNYKYLSSGNITVTMDTAGPEIIGFVKKELNTISGAYEISVKVKDDSTLNDKAWLKYIAVVNGKIQERDIALSLSNGVYTGIFEKNDSLEWHVDYILFKDEFDNASCVYNSMIHSYNSINMNSLKLESDEVAPVITGIEVKDTEINGEFDVKVMVEDSASELSQEAFMVYATSNNGQILEREIKLTLKNNVYVGVFEANDFDVELEWKVSNIIVSDVENNIGIYYNNDYHGNITNSMNLSSGNIQTNGADVDGPELVQMAVSHEKFDINDDIRVEMVIAIKASDLSGLSNEAYVLYKTETGSKQREIKLQLGTDGIYRALTVFSNADAGDKWIVDYVILKDVKNNSNVIYNAAEHGIGTDLSEHNVIVEGDRIGVEKINVDTRDISLTGFATIEIETIGIAGEGVGYALYFNAQGEEREITMTGQKNYVSGRFEDVPEGVWNLSYVIIGDKKGNRQVIYNAAVHGSVYPGVDLSGAMIDVETKLPEIESVSVSSSEIVLYDNETSTLTINVKDKTLIGYNAYVKYVGEGFEKEIKMNRFGGAYRADITVDDQTPEGTIKIDYIVIKDADGTPHVMYNSDIHGFGVDMTAGNIMLKNPELGLDVISINVDNADVDLNDQVKVTVEVSKGAFELKDKAYMSYAQAEGVLAESKELILTKVGETTYEGIFQTTNAVELGHWRVDYVIVGDVNNNSKINYNSINHKFGDTGRLWKGSIKAGEVVVYVLDAKLERGVDLTPNFFVTNMINEEKVTTIVLEVMDKNNEVISRIKVAKKIEAYGSDYIRSRIRITDEAVKVRAVTLDENNNVKYVIFDQQIK